MGQTQACSLFVEQKLELPVSLTVTFKELTIVALFNDTLQHQILLQCKLCAANLS